MRAVCYCSQNKARSGRGHPSVDGTSSSDGSNSVRLNMDEVLRGIGNVKLKKTARSRLLLTVIVLLILKTEHISSTRRKRQKSFCYDHCDVNPCAPIQGDSL